MKTLFSILILFAVVLVIGTIADHLEVNGILKYALLTTGVLIAQRFLRNSEAPSETASPVQPTAPARTETSGPSHLSLGQDAALQEPPSKFITVPKAKDGSVFSPELKRAGGFMVGAKGHERKFEEFSDALAFLRTEPTAYWRRPNAEGNWGIVTGVGWVELRQSPIASEKLN